MGSLITLALTLVDVVVLAPGAFVLGLAVGLALGLRYGKDRK